MMSNRSRRSFLRAGGLIAALSIAAPRVWAQPLTQITVYKSPACGCCGEWVKHLEANGFRVEAHNVANVDAVKRRFGVPAQLGSCHTAIVDGYAIEGHVPASDIRKLLAERPNAVGLAVPGMPIGSPGMEGGTPQRYETLLFDSNGAARVYARH